MLGAAFLAVHLDDAMSNPGAVWQGQDVLRILKQLPEEVQRQCQALHAALAVQRCLLTGNCLALQCTHVQGYLAAADPHASSASSGKLSAWPAAKSTVFGGNECLLSDESMSIATFISIGTKLMSLYHSNSA